MAQALKTNPGNARLELSLAQALEWCGRLDEAVAPARRTMELAPENELGPQTLCSIDFARKDYAGTIAAGRDALSLNPADASTHLKMGMALLDTSQIPEAISQLTVIVDVAGFGADAHHGLSQCFLNQGKREDGLAHLREAVRLSPVNQQWQNELRNPLEPPTAR